MSYYYEYYIGYEDSDGLIYPLGPFDNRGNIHPVLLRSRSFASDLHDLFYLIPEEKRSKELIETFHVDDDYPFDVKMLDFKDLPNDNFVKHGYFLIEDVEGYLEDGDCWDRFYERLDPLIYFQKAMAESTFGLKKDYDPETEDPPRSCADYMYFAYPNYISKEYETHLINQAKESLYSYKIKKYVVLETEG